MTIRPRVLLVGAFAAILGIVALSVVRQDVGPAPLKWESAEQFRPVSDSTTILVLGSFPKDGLGDPDSFVISLAIQSTSGVPAPTVFRRTSKVPSDSFRVATFPPGVSVDLSVTIQAFRGSHTSRPVASGWRYPRSSTLPAPRIDSVDSARFILDLPPVGFGGVANSPASVPRPAAGRVPPRVSRPGPDSSAPVALPPASTQVGNSGCANEPPGYRVISRETWKEVPAAGQERNEPGWFSAAHRNRFSIIEDPTLPDVNKRVIQGMFPEGHPGGRGPFKLVQRFQGNYHALYMCMWHKISDNFTNNGNVGTKFGFLLTPYDEGSHRVHSYLNLSNRLGINLSSIHGTLNRNMQSRFDVIRNRGQWHRIEWLIVANTEGEGDGVARIWVDGQQMLNEINARYFFPDQKPQFVGITWNPTYGGGVNPVPYDMYEWIGEWYISGQ